MAETPSRSPVSRPARSGDAAVQEELALGRAVGTVEAFSLFIARHPDHPLAQVARTERERLAGAAPR